MQTFEFSKGFCSNMLYLHIKTNVLREINEIFVKRLLLLSFFNTAQMRNEIIMWLLSNAKCSHCFVMQPLQNPPLCSSNDWKGFYIYPAAGGTSSKRHISWRGVPPAPPTCPRWGPASPASAACAAASTRPSRCGPPTTRGSCTECPFNSGQINGYRVSL